MSLPELCIRRPVMTTLLMMSFVIFGLVAFKKLPMAALPKVDFPTITVSAQLPGANPTTMASTIAAPLERQFTQIAGLSSLTSVSSAGSTSITLQFDLDREIDGAALDVQTAISAASRRLPLDMPSPPTFRKTNPGDFPILFLALTSDTLPLPTVNFYAENVVQQQISQIPGVAQVQVFGSQKHAVRIFVNPQAASARGLTMNDIGAAVQAANSNRPVGLLRGENQTRTIEATGQLERAKEYGGLTLTTKNQIPVKLEDVATVIDSVENDENAGWYNGERAIVLAIFRQSDANTVEVVDKIKALMPQYQSQIPPSVTLRLTNDRSISIRDSVEDVEFTLILSVILVVLVIFVFLKRLSATLIPSLALPVSIAGTFGFMYLLGYSLDNISLLALTLAVGFVVDDAIVMLENIVRHIEMGKKPFEAALIGAREISFTIISITLSLVAVFIPVFFMGGVVGRIFREFAVTISITILVSGFVSLTLTPMLCARLLKPHDANEKPKFHDRIFDAFVDGMAWFYRVTLDLVLKFRFVVLLLTFVVAWLSVHHYKTIPQGFFPQEDTGLLRIITEAASDISFPAMVDRQTRLERIVRDDPAVDYATSSVGFGGANRGFMFVLLKPKKDRDRMELILSRMRRNLSQVPGILAIPAPIQNINLTSGRASRAAFQYTLTSPDLDVLYDFAPQIVERLQTVPILRDVTLDLQLRNPQVTVDINREAAAQLGVSSEAIRSTLYNAFGSRQVTTVYTSATDYAVIMEADRNYQNDPEALSKLYVRNQNGQNVPLTAVASLRRTVGPLSVTRIGQQPAVTISFNLGEGVAIGVAIDAVREIERTMAIPAQITTGFSGAAQLADEAKKGQVLLLITAVLVIYIVLGVLYESFIHPITILSGLPSASLGALLALKYYGMDLSVVAIIGILMLIGIVKKNAIMMVDFALERQRSGVDALTAIREAALVRFRPIMMTTFAAIFGVLPIALGAGAGAELRQPLGIAVVGGLCVSQLLTLYFTPVIFYYMDKVEQFFAGKKGRAPLDGSADDHQGHSAVPAPVIPAPPGPAPALASIALPIAQPAVTAQGATLARPD